MIALDILGIGVVGPGLPNWEAVQAVLTGDAPYQAAPPTPPPPAALPPNERRRATLGTRIALEAGAQALARTGLDPRDLASVFAASESDLGIIDRICTDMLRDGQALSPIVFHNSVHNAVAGYWSIAQGSQRPSTSLSAWDGTLAAGLLEALAQIAVAPADPPVLLVASDLPGPWPLAPHRSLGGPFACALVLAATRRGEDGAPPALATLSLALVPRGDEDRLPPNLGANLESLRAGNPAARVLPLLRVVATGRSGAVRLPYLDDLDLVAELY
jgi:hypothetical protein